ncbi:MAG: RidA family protein [Actinomycetota bacterium]|nr:RidA family protein [Actinomycetota bacterium]
MNHTAITVDGAYQSKAFSHGVLGTGTMLAVAGQLALNEDGTTHAPGDLDAQIAKVWSQIEGVVTTAGGDMGDIVKITSFVTHPDHIGPVVASRADVFPGGQAPASTLVVVAALARPDFLVEIEALAVLP